MPTVIPQDDSGTVAGANAYHDLPFVDQYFRNVGFTSWATRDETRAEELILYVTQTTDAIFATRYLGYRLRQDQTTEFPRGNLREVNSGWWVYGIPLKVKYAMCEFIRRAFMYGILYPDSPSPVPEQSIASGTQTAVSTGSGEITRTRVEVGPIVEEFEYNVGSTTSTSTASRAVAGGLTSGEIMRQYPEAVALLSTYLGSGTHSRIRRVY